MPGFVCLLAFLAGQAPGSEPADAPPPEPAASFYATATVRERLREQATAAVTVIDRETIEASGARTVADVLAFVPGVHLEPGAGRGGLTVARIRGGDPNFTRVLIDGVPVADGTYQVGGVFNFETLPAAAVERIEVVRGPLSAFYGSTGLAGAIQVFTRDGTSGAPRAEAALTAGDASLTGAYAALAGAGESSSYHLSLLFEAEDGRIAEESFELGQFQGRWQRELEPRSSLRLAGRTADSEAEDYPEASGGPLFGSGELRRTESREASFGAELWLGRRHRLAAALYHHDRERTSPAIGLLVPESEEATRFTRVRLGWASTFEPRPGLRLTAGLDVEREDAANASVLLLPPFLGGAAAGDYRLERTTPGAYGELVADRGRLTLELGTRVDFPEGGGERLSPRLGIGWRLGDAARLRASAGRSFKLPSFFALASPPALGGNPDLRPEVMEGFDLGVERTCAGGARAGLAVFHNLFRQLVDFDFAAFRHVNRAEVEARGVELSFGARPAAALTVAAALTWQQVEDRATGGPLRPRPEWVGSLRLDWRPRPRLDLHLDLRGVSRRHDEQIPVPERRTAGGYRLLGFAGTWRATSRVALEVRLDNLAGESYETMIGFPGPGRSIRAGLRFKSR